MKIYQRLQKFLLILPLSAILFFLSAPKGNTALKEMQSGLELCPAAGSGPPTARGANAARAAKLSEDREALLRELDDPDSKIVRNAVLLLSQVGSLDTYRILLTRGDANLLRQYSSHYRNRDGTLCLDPEIEASIVENLDNPVIIDPLLSFFHKNLYRSTALFDRLIAMTPDFRQTRIAILIVKALVATNLPDIEQKVLDHAERLNSMTDQRFWWLIPQIERNYFDFFLKRGYIPAIAYMQSILDVVHYSMVRGNPQTHLFNRHRYIYYVLDRFPSSHTGDVFIKQLGKLVHVERGSLFSNEMKAAGEYAVKHALSLEQKEEINRHLIQVLESIRSEVQTDTAAARTDFVIRIDIIKLLGKTGTETSARTLIMELDQTVHSREKRTYATLVARILESIMNIPEEVEINAGEFLDAARNLDDLNRFLYIPQILTKHRAPEGHAYLLSLLEEILATEKNFKRIYGDDRDDAFMHIMEDLARFDKPEYVEGTVNGIDTLFQSGKLPEKLYITASEYFMDSLESESSVYKALMGKKKALKEARRKEAAEEKRRKWEEKHDAVFAQETSPEGIKKNLQALEGGNRRRPAKWLIIAGPDILPYAHRALLDPEVSMRIKFSLMDVLGAIGDARSIEPIIKAARKAPNDGLNKSAFLSLGQIPQTRASFEFAAEQLENERSPRAQRNALAYFILHRDRRSLKWARRFAGSGSSSDLQAGGLYLLARLGERKAKEQILEVLKKEEDRSLRQTLLRALAELATIQEFYSYMEKFFPDGPSRVFETAGHIAEFRHSTGDKKSAAAEKLLHSELLLYKREAVRHLIGQNEIEILRKHFPVNALFLLTSAEMMAVYSESPVGMIILLEARRKGLRVEQTSEGIQFRKK